MPTKVFFDLKEEKKEKIVQIGITEFAEYSYDTASTNRIIKNAGISKGSLFQYFTGKEDYYLFIVDVVLTEYSTYLRKLKDLPAEWIQRIIRYAEYEFEWYIENPLKYRLIRNIFLETDAEIAGKITSIYQNQDVAIFEQIMQEADLGKEEDERKRKRNLIKWLLEGFNNEFRATCDDRDLPHCKDRYIEELTLYMNDLSNMVK